MPGTNHQFESQFMDHLSFSARHVADDILGHDSLKTILDYKVNGINDFYKKKYSNINDLEWSNLIRAVTLTKLSYFEFNNYFTNHEIDKWIEIAQDSFELPHGSPLNLYKIVEHKYPIFTKVVKTAILIKQQRLKKALANNQKT